MWNQKILVLVALLLCLVTAHECVAQAGFELPFAVPVQDPYYLAWKRHPIEGFAWPQSIRQGEALNLYVSVVDVLPSDPEGQSYDIYFYRNPNVLTWVRDTSNIQGHFFPLHFADHPDSTIPPGDTSRKPIDFKRGCIPYWNDGKVSFSTAGWEPGMYYARFVHRWLPNVDSNWYYITFILRPESPGGSPSKVLQKHEFTTYQAYNYWGGGSLYSHPQDPLSLTPTDTIALARPLVRELSKNEAFSVWPFVQIAQDNGYTIEFCNNIDLDSLDFGQGLLSQYKMLILLDHDEYWYTEERDNIELFFKQRHGNITHFGANTCYWRINRINFAGSDYLKLSCIKSNWPIPRDPVDLWRYNGTGGANRPEATFLGIEYERGYNIEYPPDSMRMPEHWIFRGTGIQQDSLFGYGIVDTLVVGGRRGIVGTEVDNSFTDPSPFPLQILAERSVYSVIAIADTGYVTGYLQHQMAYHEDTLTNSRVFSQGGMGWPFGLVGDGVHTQDVERIKRITINIFDHFSGKKYLGKVWTADPEHALEWRSDVELDGDTHIPTGKYLRVFSQSTVTIDSGVTFNIDGTLEINGSVTITGTGKVHIGATGTILLASGATLKIKTTVQTADSVTVSVPSATTLRIDTLGKTYFGIGSRINVSGAFIAQGTTASPILLTRATSNNDYWSGITLNEFASATLNHCNILHAQVGINANSVQPTISHCMFDSCKIGVSLFQSAGAITNSLFTHNIIKGVIIDGEYDYIEPSAVPLLTDNIVSSNTTGIYISNSAPILERDTIEDNAQYGIACVNNGNAFVSRNDIDAAGQNVLNSNGTANLFVDNSSPFLGYADERIDGIYGGYNSFGPEKHEYDVWAQNESAVIARKNYWSEYPPDEESSFHTSGYGFSTIDWELPLEDFGCHPASAPYTITKTQGLLKRESSLLRGGIADSTLHAALNLRSQKKYAQLRK